MYKVRDKVVFIGRHFGSNYFGQIGVELVWIWGPAVDGCVYLPGLSGMSFPPYSLSCVTMRA